MCLATVDAIASTFDIHVRPGARQTRIDGLHDGVLAVRVAAKPTDGQANDAVVSLLAEALRTRRSAVRIVRGLTSRRKQIAVDGVTASELDELLAPWLAPPPPAGGLPVDQ